MGDGDKCNIGLLRQHKSKAKSSVRREVGDEIVRKPGVGLSIVVTVVILILVLHAALGRSLSTLVVLWADKAALDTNVTVMVENNEGAAAGDVIGVVGPTQGFKVLDLRLKFAEADIDIVGKFFKALVLLGEEVELGLRGLIGGLILCRELDLSWINPPKPVTMRKIKIGLHPFPALIRLQCRGDAARPLPGGTRQEQGLADPADDVDCP
ncbi:hypothetical protein JQ627_13305 [Bradyrhizobium liaoningense]|nr:hypothetical protein [Bradyrhizobium liaoningense]